MPDSRLTAIQDCFDRLNARAYSTLGEILTEDSVFDVVNFPEGAAMPNPTVGRQAFQDVFVNIVDNMFNALEFTILETYLGVDPDLVVVEYATTAVAKPTGRPYSNRYVGIFRVRDGKIAFWREYHNPERMTQAFGNPAGGSAAPAASSR